MVPLACSYLSLNSSQLLRDAGFNNITCKDRTAQVGEYISNDIQKAEQNKDDLFKVCQLSKSQWYAEMSMFRSSVNNAIVTLWLSGNVN